MKLSILICSLEQRKEMLESLLQELRLQIVYARAGKKVEILTDIDRGEKIIGQKRNDLLDSAKGVYITYIDDDDWIYSYYIREILNGLRSKPDVLGINGVITSDGARQKKWFISIEYPVWTEDKEGYYRFPNHITPVKREYALKAKFPLWNNGEDYIYADKLRKFLKTEVKIKKPLYLYRYSTKDKSYSGR